MKKTRWFEPYYKRKSGTPKPALKDCWTCAQAGVYMIRHKGSDSVVYVGSSRTQLKKTIYRHFEQWTDKQHKSNRSFERKTYPKFGYEIRFFKCTASQAVRMEKYLIQKMQPKDNPLKYSQLGYVEIVKGKHLYNEAIASECLSKEDYTEVPF